ncbi:PP2C family protein-serine/threonine phosphatase [Streptomyces sp. NPDC091377]|uniref:PP2C family protein-serine/threonine phosphatase n=1 Tax=Streptomyces sp. NPDC091377 TaxID=3365995 RepID=UPI0037FDE958
MPSPRSADRPAAPPPGGGPVDALISQTRRLKGEVDAVRRDAQRDDCRPRQRWQRALYDLALRQLDALDAHFAQLREEPRSAAPPALRADPAAPGPGSLLSRVGSAEWDLLTDEANWSAELYAILGRDPAAPPLTLDELPSLAHPEDRPRLTALVTDCLVDAQRIDGEFRVLRPDGTVRTVHMMGEPVLGPDGGTVSMWAVLRDVSALRRSQAAVSETRDSLRRHRRHEHSAPPDRVEIGPAVLPAWRGPLRLPRQGAGTLDLAARCLPASTGPLIGGDWYDVLELPGGELLLSVGELTGRGLAVTTDVSMALGALRGTALAGTGPGQMLSWLNRLLDGGARPALGSAVCCRWRPARRTLVWAGAGHPAPLLFRDGTGRRLSAPRGVLLGTTSGAEYGESEVALAPGDVLLFHTDGLVPARWRSSGSGEAEHRGAPQAADPLLGLAPRLAAARSARDGLRTVEEEFGETEREDDACVLIARVES